jgi:muramoyltetrapeptide carboxypeptidase
MTELISPTRLAPGATIGVAAISGPTSPERLDRGIAKLRALGYGVREASNLRRTEGLFAGSDRDRAAGYRELLADPEVDAVFFARGGYGATRVIERLDPSEIAKSRKPHLGGSDLTALFAVLRRIPMAAFYGPMVAVEIASENGLDWREVLEGATPAEHRFGPKDVIRPGVAEGALAGGCLSLLASLCGTPEAVFAPDGLLFWEDIGEEMYRIDRLLTQLERSGTFDRIQGMVIGSVVSRDRAETPERVREYLRDRFRTAPFPVAMGLPAGHLPRPRTLPLHVRASLRLDGEAPVLSFPAPAVARP